MALSMALNNHDTIPARWLDCPRKGLVICGKLLPMKVPLDSRYDSQIPEQCRFNVPILLDSMKKNKIPLRLIIDLTNTSRYYNKAELKEYGVSYEKLSCQGHLETPSADQIRRFIYACDSFYRTNPHGVIGVHSTHGFNTTGFLIIVYLIERGGLRLDAAVREFSSARPPGIYKQAYLDGLVRRYAKDLHLVVPVPPDWSLDHDDSVPDDESKKTSCAAQRTSKITETLTSSLFMGGKVGGAVRLTQQHKLVEIQTKVKHMCRWKKPGFPGALPVALGHGNLDQIFNNPYKVSWKANGIRFLMLIDGPGQTYLIDRDNAVFHVPAFSFWWRKDLNEHLCETLIDGEMVIDKDQGIEIPRFLVSDVIRFKGLETGRVQFSIRRFCIDREIIHPRLSKIYLGKLDKSKEPFSIRAKDFFDLEKASSILDGKFSEEVCHGMDGLIFVPEKLPYCPGRCQAMLKWKPPYQNTLDFRFKIVNIVGETIHQLYVGGNGGRGEYFGIITFTREQQEEIKSLHNQIVECSLNTKTSTWVFERHRTDRSRPNSYRTASSILEAILNPLSKQQLLEYIAEWAQGIRNQASKYRHRHDSTSTLNVMPPPKKVARK